MKELLDAIDALLVVFDEADLLYTSSKLQTTLGYRPATVYDLIDVSDHEFIGSGEYRQQPQPKALYFRKYDGTLLPVSLSVKPVTYEGKAGWLGTAVDMTAQWQLEMELREIHEQYRTFIELLSSDTYVMSFEQDHSIRLDSASQRTFQRITGYTWAEMAQLPQAELASTLYPTDADLFIEHQERIWRGQPANGTYRLRTRKGDGRWLHVRRLPVMNAERRVIKYYSIVQDITARKEAEEALRQSEERYRIITELISDYAFSFRFEADGSITSEWTTDDSFQRITGYTPAEIDTLGDQALYHPDERDRVRADVQQTMAGQAISGEYRIVTRQGETRFIHLYRQPIFDDRQRIIRFYGVAQDITERKITEAALRQSEERYRVISELISDYAYSMRVDPDGTRTMEWITHDSFHRMTGYGEAELPLITNLALFHPQDRDRTRHDIDAVRSGATMRGEYRIVTRQGETRTVRFHRMPIFDEQTGQVIRYYGVAQDITEQKQAEKALQDSEERYRTLARNFPNGIVALFNSDLRYTLVDGEGLRQSGIRSEDMIGKTLAEVYPPDIAKRDEPYLRAALDGIPSVVELPFGDILYEVHTLPIKDETGRIVGGMVMTQNITGRRKMEEAMRAQSELQILLTKEQDLSQLKNRLMGLITHEFRTPLAVISNSLGMLERHMDTMPEEKRAARVRQIYRQIDHLTEMLDDMAVVVRGEMRGMSFKPSRIDVVALCRELFDVISGTLGAEHQLVFTTSIEKLSMVADGRLIQRILRNLLSNAIKYSAQGTRIEVTLTQSESHLELKVSDQGKGIPVEEQPYIFEPFYRSETIQTIPGLGLGLGIVKDAVEMHLGEIEVQSTPGAGACFIVRLPIPNPQ